MIRLSVLYPKGDNTTFDHDYYREKHVPLCSRTWKPDAVEIDRGVDGPYVAAVHVVFKSQEAMSAALANSGELMADVPNYTNITPVMQISEVVETK